MIKLLFFVTIQSCLTQVPSIKFWCQKNNPNKLAVFPFIVVTSGGREIEHDVPMKYKKMDLCSYASTRNSARDNPARYKENDLKINWVNQQCEPCQGISFQ